MNMQKTAREIGLLETAVNLSKFCNSEDVMQKVGASMPLPDENIRDRIIVFDNNYIDTAIFPRQCSLS